MDTRDLGLVVAGAGAGAASVTAYQAWRAATERTVLDGKPTTLARVDAGRVVADPDTFQFKSGGDAKGVTDRLKGVKSWNPAAAGKVMVFERADGQQVIADGHQRTGLAQRLMADGHAPIKLDAIVLREKDGWSARDVRAYAAIKNMHESSGNPLDMAKVMRERPDLVTSSLPVTDAKIRDAKALANLSDPAFRMVTSGTVKPELAAAVGESVKEASRHVDLLTEMAKAKVETAQHAKLYVGQAMAGPSITESNLSLFGDEQQTRSLIAERAQVLDKAMTALRNDKRIFGLLEREASSIEAAGNKLAHETNMARAEGAQKTAALVEKLATVKGRLSSMLDDAARQVAEGKKPAEAARAFVRQVGATVRDGGIQALTGDGPVGWSDQARASSAKTRKANARVMEMVGKPTASDLGSLKGVQIDAMLHDMNLAQSGTRAQKEARIAKAASGSSIQADTVKFYAQDLEAARKTMAEVKAVRSASPTPVDDGFPSAMSAKPHAITTQPPKWSSAMGARDQSSFLPDATTKEQTAAAAKSKGKASVAQKDAGGLFSDDAKQMDIVDEVRKYQPKSDTQIVESAKGKPAPSAERMAQLDRRVDAASKAELARAARGDEAGYEKAKRVYAKVQDQQLTAVAAKAGTPPGWSDEARAASAEARAAKPEPRGMDGLTRAERSGKTAGIAVQPVDAPSTLEKFRATYEKTLAGQVKANPGKYAYGVDRVPDMARKMTDALANGTGDVQSRTVQAVAKSLGIKPTVGGLKAALNDQPPPAPRPQKSPLEKAEAAHVKAEAERIRAWKQMQSGVIQGPQYVDISRKAEAAKKAFEALKPTNPNYTPGVGTTQESYWTAKAGPTPTVNELPPGAFKGTQAEFESLSPGIRREIARTAEKMAAKTVPEADTTAPRSPSEAARLQKAADVWKDVGKPAPPMTRAEKAELKKAQKEGIAKAKAQIAAMSEPAPAFDPDVAAISDKTGNQWRKHSGSDSWSVDRAASKPGDQKPSPRLVRAAEALFGKVGDHFTRDELIAAIEDVEPAPGRKVDKSLAAAREAVAAERQGWSDEARAASAEVRKADAKPLDKMTTKELRAEAKARGMVGHSNATKANILSSLRRPPISIIENNPYDRAPTPSPDTSTLKSAAAEAGVRLPDMSKEKPTPLTAYQRQFQAGPRQPDYRGDPGAEGTPTSKSRGQLLAEAREKGIKGIAKMETRTLASKLGYKLNYALGAMTIGGAAAAGLLAADAARNSAQAAGKSEADTQLATVKAGVVATAVAGGTIAVIGKGVQLVVAAAPKLAPFVNPVGAVVGVGYAAYGAYHGYQQTGTMKGAALGAVSGGHVFESWRKPGAGPVRLSIAQQAAFAAASLEHQAKQDAATPDDGKRSGWSNAARIAAAKAQGHAAPYGGNPYVGPAQWAPPASATTAETTTASITAAMKRK